MTDTAHDDLLARLAGQKVAGGPDPWAAIAASQPRHAAVEEESRASGDETEAKLAQDRTECLSFVQAHPETSTQLAEAACLIERGYRAPVEMSLGSSRLGQLFTDARGDATSMVRDFQACRVDAASAPMPEVSDTVKTGIVGGFFGQLYPRGFFTKAQTSDEWITKSFGECLKRRGYTVTDVTTFSTQ